MQLNELINREGIEVVSEKTNISIENLNYLYEQNFEALNRVKALGFIKIFEREYRDLDLEPLKEAIKEYYDSHDIEDEPVLVSVENNNERDYSFIKWIFLSLIISVLYYLYAIGKFSSPKSTENILQDSKVLAKDNVTEDIAKNRVVIKKDANETKVEIKVEDNKSKKRDKIQNIIDKKDINISSKIGKNSKNKKIVKDKNNNIEQQEQTQNQNLFIMKNIDLDDDNSNSIDSNNTTIDTITVNPKRYLWFGFINLDTKKKKEFMGSKSTPFDLKGHRWVLLTGHGFVEVVSEQKSIDVVDNRRKKHYFYMDSHTLKEITYDELKKLNGGKGW